MSEIKKPIFRELNADDPEPEATQIESLCMNCMANGVTRLLLTRIPYYKDVVIMSFACEECGYQNNEIQSSGVVADKGIRLTLTVETQSDLNRQVVKSDYTSIKILEVDFEIPAKSQKGEVTTVEGIINRSITGLEQDQPVRRIQHPEAAKQIDEFVEKLQALKTVEKPFTIILEDISGNSHVENPNAPQKDTGCTIHNFIRSKEQNHELGLFSEEEVSGEPESKLLQPIQEGEFTLEDFEGEVLHFPTNCNNCGSPCQTNMKMTNIPHFKEVVIMATCCEVCGNRTNEVKSGGGIESQGLRIEVDISTSEDLTRDVLKSETCSLSIPQLEFEVGPSALGGRFSTIEGIIVAMKDQICDPNHSCIFGDSLSHDSKQRFENFIAKLDEVLDNKRMVTLVLDDPAGNSYIQSMKDDDTPDDRLRITRYERNYEQNDELGLNDMKTENYQS